MIKTKKKRIIYKKLYNACNIYCWYHSFIFKSGVVIFAILFAKQILYCNIEQ